MMQNGGGHISRSGSASARSNFTTISTTNRRRLSIMPAPNYHHRHHHHLIIIIASIITLSNNIISFATAQSKDSFFCGTSWADASSNCDDRQPCPNALDEECSTPGHICFADTLCSIAAGDGEKFKFIALANLANVDYDDKANNMFCGSWWATAEEHCSVDTHCTSGEQCGGLDHCFDTGCHVQDILQVELGDD